MGTPWKKNWSARRLTQHPLLNQERTQDSPSNTNKSGPGAKTVMRWLTASFRLNSFDRSLTARRQGQSATRRRFGNCSRRDRPSSHPTLGLSVADRTPFGIKGRLFALSPLDDARSLASRSSRADRRNCTAEGLDSSNWRGLISVAPSFSSEIEVANRDPAGTPRNPYATTIKPGANLTRCGHNRRGPECAGTERDCVRANPL